MRNSSKLIKKVSKTGILASSLFAAGVFVDQSHVSANAWQANSVEQVNQAVQQSNPAAYSVRYGDTLWALSQVTNQSINQIAQKNGVVNPDLIYAGSTLALNGGATTAASNQTVASANSSQTNTQTAEQAQGAATNDANAVEDQQAVQADAKQTSTVAKQAAQAAAVAQQNADSAQAKADQLAAEKAKQAQIASQAQAKQAQADAKLKAKAAKAAASQQQAIATQARQQAEQKQAQAVSSQTKASQAQAKQAASQAQQTTPAVAPKQDQQQANTDAVAQSGDATFTALNALRQQNGLAPLKFDPSLSAQATARAAQVNASQSVPANHFSTSGEVIAIGWNAGTPVVNAWYNETNMIGAPGHRNWEMNANYTTVGIGHVGNSIVGLAR